MSRSLFSASEQKSDQSVVHRFDGQPCGFHRENRLKFLGRAKRHDLHMKKLGRQHAETARYTLKL
jgi:hypothetical protein